MKTPPKKTLNCSRLESSRYLFVYNDVVDKRRHDDGPFSRIKAKQHHYYVLESSRRHKIPNREMTRSSIENLTHTHTQNQVCFFTKNRDTLSAMRVCNFPEISNCAFVRNNRTRYVAVNDSQQQQQQKIPLSEFQGDYIYLEHERDKTTNTTKLGRSVSHTDDLFCFFFLFKFDYSR